MPALLSRMWRPPSSRRDLARRPSGACCGSVTLSGMTDRLAAGGDDLVHDLLGRVGRQRRARHHRALPGQRPRARGPDPGRRPRDQRHLAFELSSPSGHLRRPSRLQTSPRCRGSNCPLVALLRTVNARVRYASTCSAVPTWMVVAPRAIRRTRPESTLPGPTSTKVSKPSASHPLDQLDPAHRGVDLPHEAVPHRVRRRDRARRRRCCRAGRASAAKVERGEHRRQPLAGRHHQRRVERRRHRQRHHALGAARRRAARRRARPPPAWPAITVCSGALKLAATTTSSAVLASRHAASTSPRAGPSTADIAPDADRHRLPA